MNITSFNFRKATLGVLIACLIVVILIFIVSFIYYSNLNSAEDPRVLEAKNLQLVYDKGLEGDESKKALDLLEKMRTIYARVPGYANSYEVGVILNNKATVYLVRLIPQLIAIEESLKDKDENEIKEVIRKVDTEKIRSNLNIALGYTLESIEIYEGWLEEMGGLTEDEIRRKIQPDFDPADAAFSDVDFQTVFEKRVEDVKAAQFETKRRLSVAVTNLGVIQRYMGNLQESKANYEKALELWERNYTARDNLDTLMNRPKEKRSMVDRFFPPERLKQVKAEGQEEAL